MPADETNDLLRETFRKFALDRLLPNYQRWKTESFDPDLLRELGRLGALGIAIPEEYGGSGGTRVQLGIAAEEIGRGDFNVTGFLQIGAITELLLRHADEPLRRQWLPPLASGEAIPSFGLTEPSVGSDAAKLQMTARRDGSDWVLRGEKASITFAGLASVCMVFARTGGDGARGISVFAVPLDFPGVARQVYTSAGGTLVQRGSLFFDDVRIPAACQVGADGTGFIGAMQAFDFNRAIIALAAIGAAAQSLDETMVYAKTRETFGRPLAKHEGVAFQIAEHLAMVHAARLVSYEVLARADAGLPHTSEAAMSKWLGPKAATDAIHACVILNGWPGYGADLPLMQRLTDVMGLEIGDGTPELMKAIIAREAMGREFASYK